MKDPNAGRFGLNKEELIKNSYDRLKIASNILGYKISPISLDGVKIIDANGSLFKALSIDDLINGTSI